jgi:predicted RNA-binding Zn-ribbon protein involved in translation (DUF1610 family)
MFACSNCGKQVIWGGDHTYEDYGMDDGTDDDNGGIVSNYSCPNDDCGVETIIVYMKN